MTSFQTSFLPPKNAGLPMSFQMRYCMTFHLKGHQNYQKSKLTRFKRIHNRGIRNSSIVQVLYKFCTSFAQVLHKFCPSFAQILHMHKFCTSFAQILHKFCTSFVQILIHTSFNEKYLPLSKIA